MTSRSSITNSLARAGRFAARRRDVAGRRLRAPTGARSLSSSVSRCWPTPCRWACSSVGICVGPIPASSSPWAGPACSGAFPALLGEFSDAVDYVCMNEGELALTDLADAIAAGDPHPRIPGFWSVDKAGSGALVAERREFANIDDLPMPAYDAVPVPEYLEMAAPRIFDVYLGIGMHVQMQVLRHLDVLGAGFPFEEPTYRINGITVSARRRMALPKFNFLHDNFANRRRYLERVHHLFRRAQPRLRVGLRGSARQRQARRPEADARCRLFQRLLRNRRGLGEDSEGDAQDAVDETVV